MRTRSLLLCVVTVLTVAALSSRGENRLKTGTRVRNPIIIESQIRDIAVKGDEVIFHLYRQPYDIVAVKWLPVGTNDGSQFYARDLQARDVIRLEGDLDHSVIFANRIVLQAREIHAPGD